MENYIDWTGKTQPGPNQNSTTPSSNAPTSAVYWQDHANGSYSNSEHEQNHVPEQPGRQPPDYGQQSFRSPYPDGVQISPSLTPPTANATQYTYPQAMSQPGYSASTNSSMPSSQQDPNQGLSQQKQQQQYQQQQQHHHNHQPQQQQTYQQSPAQNYPNPYSYANNANHYPVYAQQGSNNYMSPYNNTSQQQMANMDSNPSYSGYQMLQSHQHMPRTSSPQVQFPYRPSQSPNPTSYLQPTTFQYQRPEDALKRVHQQTWPAQYQYQNHQTSASNGQNSPYTQWQAPAVGQTVYFPMDPRPAAQAKVQQVVPSSPPRPTDPLAALRYDVSHCFTDYNTSRDLKGCSAALLAIMATCDPVVSSAGITPTVSDPIQNVAPEKLSSASIPKDEVDPKIKQTALLAVVSSEIKGAMVEEVSRNKSIRAKLRTWFVRAHKDNSYVVLKAIISVLDKLTFLSAIELAEVKFGKALVIVSRKCEDKTVKDSLAKWVPKAESSLVLEKELDVAAAVAAAKEEETKRKKAKVPSGSTSTKSDGKADPSLARAQDAASKKGEEKPKTASVATTKKNEAVAKTNTAFFKKDNLPAAKPIIAKPGMAAALAGIKARKKSDADEGLKNKTPLNTSPKPVSSSLPKTLQPAKPAFSALKLVEGLKRTASPATAPDTGPEAKKRKQKKSVSWRSDAELEQVRIFESLEPEDGEGDVAHTPHEYGNARDLDRKEGALMHGGILPDREEDFLDWTTPKAIDFTHRDLLQSNANRGPKKAGVMKIVSKVSDMEEIREKSTFLVTYGTESDIPWTPLESVSAIDQKAQEPDRPKIIPLPSELRDDWRVKQVLGDLVNARTPTYAAPIVSNNLSSPASLPAPKATEVDAPPFAAGAPDIAAILAGILAAQQGASQPAAGTSQSVTSASDTPSWQANLASAPPTDLSGISPTGFDPKLADFLAKMAAANGGMLPPPPPPPPGSGTQDSTAFGYSSGHSAQPQGMRDVRPWVKLNDGGKYREPCRFIGQGRCEKGDACPYIHPQF